MRSGPSAPSRSVLVVDDDADMRAYLLGCLRALGLDRAVEAADGATALALVRTLSFGLVVTDVVMPDLDGEALCDALKADPTTAGVPVLVVSSAPPAPGSRADGYLAKPFNAASLRAHVVALIDL